MAEYSERIKELMQSEQIKKQEEYTKMDVVVYGGYTRRELTAAMHMMTIDKGNNWKDPIEAWIDDRDIPICEEAINFFCGGEAEIAQSRFGLSLMTAPGYYMVIGS